MIVLGTTEDWFEVNFTAFGKSREKAIAVIQALEVNTLDNEILVALE